MNVSLKKTLVFAKRCLSIADFSTFKVTRDELKTVNAWLSKEQLSLEAIQEELSSNTEDCPPVAGPKRNLCQHSPIVLQLCREFDLFTQDVDYRIRVASELIRYMAEFRFQYFGAERYEQFIQAIQANPLLFIQPVHLRVVTRPDVASAWVNTRTAAEGLIYLNLTQIEPYTQSFNTETLASYLESTILHEWIHLLQLAIVADQSSITRANQTQKWAHRWHEREAVYVTERVYQTLIHQKKFTRPKARGLVRQLAYQPNTPLPFCFKEMALKPYIGQQKQKKPQPFPFEEGLSAS